jgi:hypothetical protein
MEEDSQTAEICVRQLGFAGRFWFGGGLGPLFFNASTGLIHSDSWFFTS